MGLHPFLINLFLLSASSGDCASNDAASRQEILEFRLTATDAAMAWRIGTWRSRHDLAAVPGLPFCWDLRRSIADLSADRSARRFIAARGMTVRRYVLAMYTIAAYGAPALVGLPPRTRWTTTMRRNAAIVAAMK